jgi:hypothetical protein
MIPFPRGVGYGVPPVGPTRAPQSGGLFGRLDDFRANNPGVLTQFGAGLMGNSPMAGSFMNIAKLQALSGNRNATAKFLLDRGIASTPEEAITLAQNPELISTLMKDSKVSDDFNTRKQLAAQLGLTPGSPEYQRYVGTGQMADNTAKSPTQMSPQERELLADQYKLQGPERRRFILTGSLDSASARGLNSRELTIKTADENAIPDFENTKEVLTTVKNILPDVETGFLSSSRARISQGLPADLGGAVMEPKKADATAKYHRLMTQEAITRMGQVMKGATTEGEMNKNLMILADETIPIPERQQAVDRLTRLVDKEIDLRRKRIQKFEAAESGDYVTGPGGAADGVIDYKDWFTQPGGN